MKEVQLLANLGDVNFIDYGGFLVYSDSTAEVIEEPTEDGPEIWTVYRFDLDRCSYQSGGDCASPKHCNERCKQSLVAGHVLSDNEYHAGCAAWFGKPEDLTPDLISNLTSSDIRQRGFGYLDVVSRFGAYEFDQNPTTYNRAQIELRYPE